MWPYSLANQEWVICVNYKVQLVRNVMAHAQKPEFVLPRNGRVHLNRWERQFSRLLAAELCASAWVMLDRPRSEVAWEYWLPTPIASFPFTSPPVRHPVPPGSERALPNHVNKRVIYLSKTVGNLSRELCRNRKVMLDSMRILSKDLEGIL